VVGLTVVSEMVIGLTLVAVGTSLPEAATSLMATFRGQNDLAIGMLSAATFSTSSVSPD
jgi:Ca2+/Na+ antiporter